MNSYLAQARVLEQRAAERGRPRLREAVAPQRERAQRGVAADRRAERRARRVRNLSGGEHESGGSRPTARNHDVGYNARGRRAASAAWRQRRAVTAATTANRKRRVADANQAARYSQCAAPTLPTRRARRAARAATATGGLIPRGGCGDERLIERRGRRRTIAESSRSVPTWHSCFVRKSASASRGQPRRICTHP